MPKFIRDSGDDDRIYDDDEDMHDRAVRTIIKYQAMIQKLRDLNDKLFGACNFALKNIPDGVYVDPLKASIAQAESVREGIDTWYIETDAVARGIKQASRRINQAGR